MRLAALTLALGFVLVPMEAADRPADTHVVKTRTVKSKVVKAKKNGKVKARKAAKQPKRPKATHNSFRTN